MTWTPELIDRLKAEYPKTGSSLFAIRYGLTKGQVSGMAYRLNLVPPSGRSGVTRTRRDGVQREQQREQRQAAKSDAPPPACAVLFAEHHDPDVTTDPRYSCAWPLEGFGRAMTSCGEPVQVKNGRRSPYCCKHHQRAHQ